MGKWSDLPRELVEEIEEVIEMYADKVRVCAVCKSWYSHLSKMLNHQVKRLPWLLKSFENNTEASHGLFDLTDKKFYNLHLPEAEGMLFKGSSHGWLVAIGDDIPMDSPPYMSLINPITRAQIRLPPRYTMPDVAGYVPDRVGQEYAIWNLHGHVIRGSFVYHSADDVNAIMTSKVVLSSTPYSEDCLVVAIYSEDGKLAWCKCNDEKWNPLPRSGRIAVEDVIFYNGKLHALNCRGELLVYENICSNPTFKVIAELPSSVSNASNTVYLVECSNGKLAMVMRITNDIVEDLLPQRTEMFRVFKIESNNSLWVEVKEISGDIFFLGLNSSVSLPSRDSPVCKGNCIYYTGNSLIFLGSRTETEAYSDIGMFNLCDQSLEPLPGFECNHEFLWPPPVWVMPPS